LLDDQAEDDRPENRPDERSDDPLPKAVRDEDREVPEGDAHHEEDDQCHQMPAFAAVCARRRSWPSRSRTQGAAFGGAKGKPEDAEMPSATGVIRVCRVVEAGISTAPSVLAAGLTAGPPLGVALPALGRGRGGRLG